jgi:hypothetical protein
MEFIEIQTLIDITMTRVTRSSQGTQLQLDQQRNFITLTQCIELRSIVSYDVGPTSEKKDIKNLNFGTNYKGKNLIWTFRFRPDRSMVYIDDSGDPLGHLINDLHEVPIIKNLTESINIDKPIFDIKDERFKNTIIKALPGII